jgi:GAF domain-containing protein
MKTDNTTVAIPIKIRGAVIGVVNTYKPQSNGEFSQEEIRLLESITEQLGVALDSARLFAETQQKAEQERLISEATANMRATLDIDTILQTATREIYQALGLQDVTIKLGPGAVPK